MYKALCLVLGGDKYEESHCALKEPFSSSSFSCLVLHVISEPLRHVCPESEKSILQLDSLRDLTTRKRENEIILDVA